MKVSERLKEIKQQLIKENPIFSDLIKVCDYLSAENERLKALLKEASAKMNKVYMIVNMHYDDLDSYSDLIKAIDKEVSNELSDKN